MEDKKFENFGDDDFSFNVDKIILPEDVAEDTAEETLESIVKEDKKEKRKSKHSKKMRKTLLATILWVVAIVLVSVILAGSIIIGTGEYLGIGPGRGKEVVVEVSGDDEETAIASIEAFFKANL